MYKFFKRAFDCASASLLFLVISPLFCVIAFLVAVKLGKPVFFRQKRAGLHGRDFYIMKFRTMTEEKDENGDYLPDNVRCTRLGRWLRSTSLDELPELINIIKGDMAVIGPRPLQPKYNTYYTEYEKKRFDVRGGLIPPEVYYNNTQPTWDEQLKYEADYAAELSLGNDIKIMFAVFKGLFTRYNNDYGEYVREGLDKERSKEMIVK